ncbi:DNA repair protein recA homolog 2, mitochondrial [Juglans microcarpa x Juglans regia]|uniref:DNA repair protein recA homolog 2, mitochondrial n=1 Tax=Juglans microcarpa x Juglans regia TaxID=2249226 RepID=UPI001B7DD33A|nr:DNA repair protein recA homolog 2, mitochondrial [Juglans microcarpa x Juglans regia]
MGLFKASSLVNSLRLNMFGRPRFSSLVDSLYKSGRRDGTNSICMNIRRLSAVAEVSDFECDELYDDVKAKEKDTALLLALSQLSGDFGRESMLSLQRFFRSRRAPVIPTGSLKLDMALGIGGLPKGRIVEIYGKEASGKTTLALHIIKEAQKFGGCCAYLDAENAMDPSLAEAMGVNTENLLISSPSSAENLLSVVNTLTRSGAVDVIVVDSVAALIPQCELDQMIGGTSKDEQSRIMTQALRKIHYSLSQSQTLIVFLNQIRLSPKSVQGFGRVDEVTCGGNALKFYASVRLKMIRKALLKTEDKVTGLGVCVQVVKNNLAPTMKMAELGIQFGRGFCCESEVLDLACEHGLIIKEGSKYLIKGEFFSDKHQAEQYLAESNGILDKMVMILRRELFERKRETF